MSKRNRNRRLTQSQMPHSVAAQSVPNNSWLQRAIIWLFHLLLFTTPLFFNMKTDELFEFNKMILVYFFAILIGGAWAWRMVDERRWIIRWHWLHGLVGIFFLSQLLSAFTSIHPYTSWLGYYSRFHGGVLSYLTYSIIYLAAVANLRKRDLLPFLITTLASAVLVSIYGIFEHFGHSFSCVMAGGSFNVECWVQDVQNRVFATFGQPNWMAAYLLMLLPIAIWLTNYGSKLWVRWLGLVSVASIVWALLYTKSRSGFFGVALALGLYGLAWLFVWLKHRSAHPFKWMVGSVAIIVIAIVVSGAEVVPGIAALWRQETVAPTTTPTEQAPVDRLVIGGTNSGEIRKIVWTGAVDVWKRYPILGSGPETFGYSYYLDRPIAHNMVSEWDFLYNRAHNEFLNFLATTGLVGATAYVVLLCGASWLFFRSFFKNLQTKKPAAALVFAALLSGTAGLAVSNFFGFSTVMVTVLQYLFFAVAVILSLPDPLLTYSKKEYSWQQYAQFVVVGAVACILLLTLTRYYRADLAYAQSKRLYQSNNATGAITAINEAITLNGREAVYWDQMATELTQVAVATSNTVQRTQLIDAAVKAIQMAHELNPQQRNFGKTHTRDYLLLGSVDEKYYSEALAVLTQAITLAPSDPKLYYNLGLVHIQLGDTATGIADLQKSVALKPNYEPALFHLAEQAAKAGNFDQAKSWAEQILRYNPTHATAPDMVASYSAEQVYTP